MEEYYYSYEEYGGDMSLDMSVLKCRLRDAFGGDSQETIGNKLSMTQGNVSKLLSGTQQPTLETIYAIAESYNVSVDWLLGLTDKKCVTKYSGQVTYKEAVEMAMAMKFSGGTIDCNTSFYQAVVQSDDALFYALLSKAVSLHDIDIDLYRRWTKEKLELFADKPLLDHDVWKHEKISFMVSHASVESNWLELYEKAKIVQIDIEENSRYYSPFS